MNARHAILVGTLIAAAPGALAQSYLLDDRPATPLIGFVGFGEGAESPWGFPTAPGAPTGPSPVLPTIAGVVSGDGDMFGVGLSVDATPGLSYFGALSGSQSAGTAGFEYSLYFSVDRVTAGAPGSAVNAQTALNQQPGDVFRGGSTFAAPATFIGTMSTLPAPFAGTLPALQLAFRGNALDTDDSALGLPVDVSGVLIPPAVVAAPLGNGTHNNVDGFNHVTLAAGGAVTAWTFQTAYPDTTFPLQIPSADVFDLAPGSTTFCGLPAFAASSTMGLGFGDVIDGMVVFDRSSRGSVSCGGIGAQPGIDGILFSLAPGSPSLLQTGSNPGDVFFSDFSGNFGLYASAPQLGLMPNAGGSAAASGDNIDALEFGCLGDFDHNGTVDMNDVQVLLQCFGTSTCGDLNLDGVSNILDLTLLANNLNCRGG